MRGDTEPNLPRISPETERAVKSFRELRTRYEREAKDADSSARILKEARIAACDTLIASSGLLGGVAVEIAQRLLKGGKAQGTK